MNSTIQVAIDGPAGAGKSTVAKMVAEKVSFLYIDTGAMYRALTYVALQQKINLHDGQALRRLLDMSSIHLTPTPAGTKISVGDEDVTVAIRKQDVTENVSVVASHELVRIEMVERQRQLAANNNVVLDGRDIGTYVLPNAHIKIFLTASVDERAKRRFNEQKEKDKSITLEQIKESIALRDELDSTRDFAPLKKATDAIAIDSTKLTIEQVAERIIQLITERKKHDGHL